MYLGEIYIAGAGVGKGYINNPEANQKSFIKNTFDKSSKLLYKTGDLAKWNYDGTITFIGRKDTQIKLSGYRIELGEIESQINTFPYIKKCLTIVKDIDNKKILVSYIIAEKKIVISDLLAYLKKTMPTYMIPKFILQLNEFPLTSNGKIDRKQLPIPEIKYAEQYEAPSTEIEKKLCTIWRKLFNLEKIGINDNFFELGGDSLTAIKLQTEALKYGITMTYNNIFTHPTIKELSKGNIIDEKIYNIDLNYDYTKFNKILNYNDINNLENAFTKIIPKNILLFGATGFLGAHLLDNFLNTTKTKIYCIVRKKGTEDIETRLRKVLNYYFGNKYNNYFGNRIFVLDGDITKLNLGLDEQIYTTLGESIDYVINSAAFVKHFGNYNNFKEINIDGTQNIINLCKRFKKRLYHISTISVSGMENPKSKSSEICFSEKNFFIKQDLNNVYVYTKFEAEKLVLSEINNGLDACILRLGNIVNRYSDGKFQINFSENAFINRIKAIINLKVIPKKLLEHQLEFSPVDAVADAIRIITCTKNNFSVFHVYNPNFLKISTLVEYINKLGFDLKIVSDSAFSQQITKFLNNNNKKQKISGLIQYLNKNKELELEFKTIPTEEFSLQFLKKQNYTWPDINYEYINLFVTFFNDIDYFK